MTETSQDRDTGRALRTELLVLTAIAIPTTVLFWLTDLDLVVAKQFWQPEHPSNPWAYAEWWLWDFFYRTIPLFTASLAFGALSVLAVAAFRPQLARVRLAAGVLLLTIVLGPGVLVNAIFKENWGRPRPRQTVELGGQMAYLPPLKPAFHQNGKSFPCGHCAAAFALFAFWFVFRRRRRLAWFSLIAALALGGLVGMARMAAGGHFLSDVIWSALLTFLAAWLSYYWIVDVPRRERHLQRAAAPRSRHPYWASAGYGALGLFVLFVALLDMPVQQGLIYRPSAGELSTVPTRLDITTEEIDVEISFVSGDIDALQIEGRFRGFGLPLSGVEAEVQSPDAETRTLGYRLAKRGLLKELGGTLQVHVPLSLELVRVDARDARVRIRPPTPGLAAPEVELGTE